MRSQSWYARLNWKLSHKISNGCAHQFNYACDLCDNLVFIQWHFSERTTFFSSMFFAHFHLPYLFYKCAFSVCVSAAETRRTSPRMLHGDFVIFLWTFRLLAVCIGCMLMSIYGNLLSVINHQYAHNRVSSVWIYQFDWYKTWFLQRPTWHFIYKYTMRALIPRLLTILPTAHPTCNVFHPTCFYTFRMLCL